MSAPCPLPLRPREAAKPSSWLQVVSHLDAKFGGIAALLPMFCAAAEAENAHSPVAGFCDHRETTNAIGTLEDVTCIPASRLGWAMKPALRGQMKDLVRKSDGIHIHGIWETHCAVGAALAQNCRRPYIVSAHGMLERWALQAKRLKKAVYATLVETHNLRKAACLRALTLSEVNDYRRIGLTNPVAVVPNGVAVPDQVSPDPFLEAFPQLEGKRIVLFLGRLHAKKGVTMLVRAWSKMAKTADDIHLVIAGPDFDDSQPALAGLVDELDISNQVTFTGMLAGPMKWSALAAASLFVLPSFSEGFSVAVLEALGMCVPVIVTGGCNIPEVAEARCGWVIPPEQRALEIALVEALRLSEGELRDLGERGKDLVSARFTWPMVGQQMAEVYRWVLGGPTPYNVPIFE